MAKAVLRREYKPEFKREAIKLVRGGLSSSQVARDLGIAANMVSRWVRESQSDPTHSFPGKGVMKPDDAELDRLRKEIVKLKAERDLLKKATVHSTDRCNMMQLTTKGHGEHYGARSRIFIRAKRVFVEQVEGGRFVERHRARSGQACGVDSRSDSPAWWFCAAAA